MADIARDLPVAGRAAVPALLRPAAGDCGVILMHGSAGVPVQWYVHVVDALLTVMNLPSD